VTKQQQASQQPVTSAATSLHPIHEGVIDLMRRNQESLQEESKNASRISHYKNHSTT
jgi:hypothetical protein